MSDNEDIPELVPKTVDSLGEVTVKQNAPAKVPLTIITGFLGAGKSTLLQYILTAKHGYRIAVIMNEFGDTADIEGRKIDVSSAKDTSSKALSEEFLEVANGCLCCSVKDTGAASIEKLMKRRGRFDYILLETTGLADPGPIASIFWQNEDLSEDILLDGVVCVVDGVFGWDQITKDQATGEVKESLRQVACADIVLLNKADVASSETISKLEGTIRSINPVATIERTVKGNIDLAKILDLQAYTTKPNFEETELSGEGAHHPSKAHEDHLHDEHCSHLGEISSLLIPLPVLSLAHHQAVDAWIREVLWESRVPGLALKTGGHSSLEVLRCKGVWETKDGRTFVLQGVRSLYDISEVASDAEGSPQGKIVLIGRGLDSSVYTSLRDVVA